MRKDNPVRYSSAVGEMLVHGMFKVKYCHKVFNDETFRRSAEAMFREAFENYGIICKELGFDEDHLHFIADIANHSRPQAAKLLKGYTGRKLLQQFPSIKKKYFWGSGLWSPAYFMEAVGKDVEFMQNYVKKQKYGTIEREPSKQTRLTAY